jgi:diadenosine tetraphosphatase ApaH/serine/threonine PP2A family protein phosphatase
LKDRPDNWLTLDRGEKYIFNVGSVGQPRQGIFKASFGIFEIDDQSLKIRFKLVYVDYDVDKTIEKIIAAKLPSGLADRLYHG